MADCAAAYSCTETMWKVPKSDNSYKMRPQSKCGSHFAERRAGRGSRCYLLVQLNKQQKEVTNGSANDDLAVTIATISYTVDSAVAMAMNFGAIYDSNRTKQAN